MILVYLEEQEKAVSEAREAKGDISKPDWSQVTRQLMYKGEALSTSDRTKTLEYTASS